VTGTVRATVNRPMPAVVAAAEHHSRTARFSRRANALKLSPTARAPADHNPEYTPTMAYDRCSSARSNANAGPDAYSQKA
jgi:hypothetical protein